MNPALYPYRAALVLGLTLLSLCSSAAAQDRIAFISPAGQLVTIAPDGSAPRTLTPPTRRYQFPAWSPTGSEIAVIGTGAEGSGVFTVADSADAELQTLFENPAIYLYWSPDGEKVGFLASGEGGLELQIASTQGSAPNDLQPVTSGNPLYWQWGQNSDDLLVHTGVLEAGEIAFYTLPEGNGAGENGAGQTDTQPSGRPFGTPGLFNAPGLSSSERYLAYAEFESGVNRIILRGNTQQNASVRREVRYEGLAALSWSPAEDKLAIMNPPVAAPLPYGPIRVLDAQTGDLTPIVDTTAVAFFWSPDGRYIAYIAPLRQNDGPVSSAPYVIPVSTRSSGSHAVGTSAVQAVQAPLLELRVVATDTGDDRSLSTFTPTPLFVSQFLPFFDQYALSHRIWSADSTALVLPVQSREGPKVVVVPLEGEPRVLADGEMPFWSR